MAEGMKRAPLKGGTKRDYRSMKDKSKDKTQGSFNLSARVAKLKTKKRGAVHQLTVAVHFDPLHRYRLSALVKDAIDELIEDASR